MPRKKPKPAGVPPKPTKKTKAYYDYLECCHYLEAKYGYDERDYAGGEGDESKPDLDFWHWVCKHHDVRNGAFITFSRNELAEGYEMEPWQKEIYGRYLDEFAEEGGTLEMRTWW